MVRVTVVVAEAAGDFEPAGFFVPFRDKEGFSLVSLFAKEDNEGLGDSFFGRRTTLDLSLREVIVEIVGTLSEWLCSTSTLGRGLDLSLPERIVLRTGSA